MTAAPEVAPRAPGEVLRRARAAAAALAHTPLLDALEERLPDLRVVPQQAPLSVGGALRDVFARAALDPPQTSRDGVPTLSFAKPRSAAARRLVRAALYLTEAVVGASFELAVTVRTPSALDAARALLAAERLTRAALIRAKVPDGAAAYEAARRRTAEGP